MGAETQLQQPEMKHGVKPDEVGSGIFGGKLTTWYQKLQKKFNFEERQPNGDPLPSAEQILVESSLADETKANLHELTQALGTNDKTTHQAVQSIVKTHKQLIKTLGLALSSLALAVIAVYGGQYSINLSNIYRDSLTRQDISLFIERNGEDTLSKILGEDNIERALLKSMQNNEGILILNPLKNRKNISDILEATGKLGFDVIVMGSEAISFYNENNSQNIPVDKYIKSHFPTIPMNQFSPEEKPGVLVLQVEEEMKNKLLGIRSGTLEADLLSLNPNNIVYDGNLGEKTKENMDERLSSEVQKLYFRPPLIDPLSFSEKEKNIRIETIKNIDKMRSVYGIELFDNMVNQCILRKFDDQGFQSCLIANQQEAWNYKKRAPVEPEAVLETVQAIVYHLEKYPPDLLKRNNLGAIYIVYEGEPYPWGGDVTYERDINFLGKDVMTLKNNFIYGSIDHEIAHVITVRNKSFESKFNQFSQDNNIQYWGKYYPFADTNTIPGIYNQYQLLDWKEHSAEQAQDILFDGPSFRAMVAKSFIDTTYKESSEILMNTISLYTDGKKNKASFLKTSGMKSNVFDKLFDIEKEDDPITMDSREISKKKFLETLATENPEFMEEFIQNLSQYSGAIIGRDESLKQMIYASSRLEQSIEFQEEDQTVDEWSARENASNILRNILANKNGLAEVLSVNDGKRNNRLILQLVAQKLYLLSDKKFDETFWERETGFDAPRLASFFQFDQAEKRFFDPQTFIKWSLNPGNIESLDNMAQELLKTNSLQDRIKKTNDISIFVETEDTLPSIFSRSETAILLQKSLGKYNRVLVFNPLDNFANIETLIHESEQINDCQIVMLGVGSLEFYKNNNQEILNNYIASHFPQGTSIIVIPTSNEFNQLLVTDPQPEIQEVLKKYGNHLHILGGNLGEERNPYGLDRALLKSISSKSK